MYEIVKNVPGRARSAVQQRGLCVGSACGRMLHSSVRRGRLLRSPSALARATVDLHGCRPAVRDIGGLHGWSRRFYRSVGSSCLPERQAATAAGAVAWLHRGLWQFCRGACNSCLPLPTAFKVA